MASPRTNWNSINSGDTDGQSENGQALSETITSDGRGRWADDDFKGSACPDIPNLVIAADLDAGGQDYELGLADTTAAFGLTSSFTTIRIGHDSNGNYLNGHIEFLKLYSDAKDDAWLQAVNDVSFNQNSFRVRRDFGKV